MCVHVNPCNSRKQHILFKLRLYPYLLIHSQALSGFLYEVVLMPEQKIKKDL